MTDGFKQEAAENPEFFPPQESIEVNMDVSTIVKIWKIIKGWFA